LKHFINGDSGSEKWKAIYTAAAPAVDARRPCRQPETAGIERTKFMTIYRPETLLAAAKLDWMKKKGAVLSAVIMLVAVTAGVFLPEGAVVAGDSSDLGSSQKTGKIAR
jgi:hypothetical protein